MNKRGLVLLSAAIVKQAIRDYDDACQGKNIIYNVPHKPLEKVASECRTFFRSNMFKLLTLGTMGGEKLIKDIENGRLPNLKGRKKATKKEEKCQINT